MEIELIVAAEANAIIDGKHYLGTKANFMNA
jgi:hypothetical protein